MGVPKKEYTALEIQRLEQDAWDRGRQYVVRLLKELLDQAPCRHCEHEQD